MQSLRKLPKLLAVQICICLVLKRNHKVAAHAWLQVLILVVEDLSYWQSCIIKFFYYGFLVLFRPFSDVFFSLLWSCP